MDAAAPSIISKAFPEVVLANLYNLGSKCYIPFWDIFLPVKLNFGSVFSFWACLSGFPAGLIGLDLFPLCLSDLILQPPWWQVLEAWHALWWLSLRASQRLNHSSSSFNLESSSPSEQSDSVWNHQDAGKRGSNHAAPVPWGFGYSRGGLWYFEPPNMVENSSSIGLMYLCLFTFLALAGLLSGYLTINAIFFRFLVIPLFVALLCCFCLFLEWFDQCPVDVSLYTQLIGI